MTKDLQQELLARGVRRIKLGGFDVDGLLRGKYISLDKLSSALADGFGFCDVIFGWDIEDQLYDNAAVTGWDSGYPDALAKIDPSSLRFLPQEPETAHFLVDFFTPDGAAHPACPRNLLKAVAQRAAKAGFVPKFGAEFEFWIFRETPQSLREKDFHKLEPLSRGMFGYSWLREAQFRELATDIMQTLEAYNVPVEGLHTETGPGVWEACLRYDEVVAAADKAALFKTTLKDICHRHGLAVTFMAKWHADYPGSSGHIHQSLWSADGKQNVFADGKAPLSAQGQAYLAGLLQLAPELTALYSPFINSYKRYVPGVWAPLTASWGIDNRTCSARVISGPGAKAARVEFRQTAADINPYIAMASCLASGLWGIEQGLQLPPETKGDATAVADAARLPTTLRQAVTNLAQSKVAPQILGERFVDHYVRTRDWECRQADLAVSDWELRRYFEAV